jgi:hypothetical protein
MSDEPERDERRAAPKPVLSQVEGPARIPSGDRPAYSTGEGLSSLPEGFRRVAAVLAEKGHPHPPVYLEVTARTAQEAADALGVQLGQIAKSVIFKRKHDSAPVLVVTSGDLRVDVEKVAALTGPLGRADADFVKASTGYSIGGVSPVGHLTPPME